MRLSQRVDRVYTWLNELSEGRLRVLVDAHTSFIAARGMEAAGALAYYAMFSLFPLLILMVSLASFFIQGDSAELRILDYVTQAIPVSRDLIQQVLHQTLRAREAMGLVGAVTLVWSASAAFSVLVHNINRAWPEAPRRNYLHNRLVGMSMVAVLGLLTLLAIVATTLAAVLSRLRFPFLETFGLLNTSLWEVLSNLLPIVVVYLIFAGMYLSAPNTRVERKAALVGALVATVGWRVALSLFTWFINSGFGNYRLIYGSLGGVVVLLVWIYLCSWITLYCAHLSASMARFLRAESVNMNKPRSTLPR
jgi:membrane protein